MKVFFVFSLFILLSFFVGAQENNHVQIAKDNAPAVVAINVVKDDGSTFTGTGFILTEDGLIATSRHVSEHALYLNVTFNNGNVSGEALSVASAGNVDISLLKIKAQNLPTVVLGDSDFVQPGESITVIGNPRRLQNTITSGLISQIRKKADGVIWHQISAPISPSSSGSPVFNAQGEVISIAFASYPGENNQNLNFAIPSNYLSKLVELAGYHLDKTKDVRDITTLTTGHPFSNHLKQSWLICKHFFSSIKSKLF